MCVYRKVFHSFDKNGDDEIDLAEVCDAMGIDLQEAKTHISVNDTDGNGTISFNALVCKMTHKTHYNFM